LFCISSALAQASLTVSATAVRNAIVETAIAPAGPVNSAANGQVTQPKAPEPATIKINRQAAAHLPPADGLEEADAQRGFLATLPDSAIQAAQVGSYANALGEYGFLDQVQAPDTVNPALWHHARGNRGNGLFKVANRIYQVRGFDISTMTILEGDTGLIVIDPMTVAEASRAGLDLYYQHRPLKPVVAVIYTHSHIDHFGGVKGVVSEADVAAGKVHIYAPKNFMDAVINENVVVGNAMVRRAAFQFGPLLPRGEKGQVDAGLGKTSAGGTSSLFPPTDTIEKPTETRTIDGVEIVFVNTPDTEAPAEMIMYYPQFRTLNMAELVTHNLHNLLPLRGTQVRNANDWAKDINYALAEFCPKTDILISQHQWPYWGRERIDGILRKQRDLYKFVNDQTIRLIDEGYKPDETAETLKEPASLSGEWSAREFYGTVSHDSKAVYQRVLGWYDGNPANLNPLPPVEDGKKTVEYMGGAQAILTRAHKDFADGQYRWVAQVLNQLVFAEPDNKEARELEADALEQLGYQSESSTWRNAYLEAAQELRSKLPDATHWRINADLVRAMPLDAFFDYMGVRLNGPRAEGKTIVINWRFTDTKQDYVLNLENSALTYLANHVSDHADATISLDRPTLDAINLQQTTFRQEVLSGKITIDGDVQKLIEFNGLFDSFVPDFPVVTPSTASAIHRAE
jgi:alkyl sulfatase BDS1-like metallo-beta-lactamase superfamily hydrolase